MNPKDSACLTARAASKFEAGDYDGALEDAHAAQEVDRRNSKVLYCTTLYYIVLHCITLSHYCIIVYNSVSSHRISGVSRSLI